MLDDELDDESPFKEALDPMRAAHVVQKLSKYTELVKSFVKPPKTLDPYFRESDLTDRYPMLSYVTGHGYIGTTNARWRQYFAYIALIDKEDS